MGSRGALADLASATLLRVRVASLGANGQPSDVLAREPHPVHVERVSLHARHERVLVVGANLETAVAPEHLVHSRDGMNRAQDLGKSRVRGWLDPGRA